MAEPGISGGTAHEIAESIRDLVTTGDLCPGDAVPPIRELAATLGVHRNTVAAAYRMLVGTGLAETRGRRGTVIRSLPRFADESTAAELVDLAGGNPDPALLPDLGAALAALRYRPQLYGSPTVDPGLAAWARKTMADDVQRPFAVSVTHGAVDAVDRLLSGHLARGDRVALEDPCFYASEGTVRLNGLHAVPVRLDEQGMRPDSLRSALDAGVRAVIATPRAHNPTGVSITAERAEELAPVLAGHPHVLVIEDDHFCAISRRPYCRITPSMSRRWALVRSVSKYLGPDIRVAAVGSDTATAEMLGTRLRPGAAWVSHVLQQTVAHLLADPATIETFRTARDTYGQRTDLLRETLAAAGIGTPFPTDGLNVWIPVPAAQPIVSTLRDLGWAVRDGSSFYSGPSGRTQGIRVTAARLSPQETAAFVLAVVAALGQLANQA